jgi:phytoene dehydrogenase-like protein
LSKVATPEYDAVVVGSGPNGLATAVTLADRGFRVVVLEAEDDIGGGTRSRELIVPGVLHDVCSAVHPFAVGAKFFRAFDLEEFGLRWRWAPIDLVHPLDGGISAVLRRSLDETADALGPDGRRWRQVFGPLVVRFAALSEHSLGPLVRWPARPMSLMHLGIRAGLPATALAGLFRTEAAKALFLGCAAHMFRPLNGPGTAALGLMFVAAAHASGWPVAEGGSASITRAMAAKAQSLGVTIVTGTRVRSLSDLPAATVALFDIGPAAFAELAGARQDRRHARAYRRYRYGPGAYKVELAVRGGMPWSNPEARQAGTLHLAGSASEVVSGERQLHRGLAPDSPFMIVAQQYVADPGRSHGDIHPVYSYAHVPHGFKGDATEAIYRQFERFAPGFAARVVGQHVMTPTDFQNYNPNYVGGDVITGANTLRQLFLRPAVGDPYATGVPGMYLCSASTPPGAGAHGMCGYWAAHSALAYLARVGRAQ